uniref:D-aminoacyl-tRNA deacylase n=1 Tax=Albugo laibachii Nc14 TaxID=890382 RepID=F0WYU7_9STRA|nr:DTyrtRNA(Tyr) deacylase putative [Albugo laibachii Nc14]|eukprot:CCA26656.1 DTyrtRNA(Tyr) deacylase putative [Albugo laibachii Nc14]
MRLILQRVSKSSVRVDEAIVDEIGKGILCFIGIGREDTLEDVDYCCQRLLWPDNEDKAWKTSAISNGFEILIVSQFTLHGYFSGNKPNFHLAMAPKPAKELYDQFCCKVREMHTAKVAEGVFGANTEVSLTNDGPVTMTVDSKERKPSKTAISKA